MMLQNRAMRRQVLKGVNLLRNGGSGYKLAFFSMTGVIAATLFYGNSVKNELYRCGLAGVTSTLAVEVSTHAVSTLDVHSKTTKNFNIQGYLRNNGVGSLINGFQPMIYGYIVSSYFYYSLYKYNKEIIK